MPRTVGLAEFPPRKRALAAAAVEGSTNAFRGRSRRGRRRTGAACRLLLDSRRGNDLFGQISVDGVSREESAVNTPANLVPAFCSNVTLPPNFLGA
jgi:hypothetical protein